MAVGAIAFWAVGYDILTGDSVLWDWVADLGLRRELTPGVEMVKPAETLGFLFQFAFASTAATICSGAVTARMSPHAYLIFAACFTGFIYPVCAFLIWNEQSVIHGVFRDFAGAVVVHSVGAAAGLAGTILLRPRIGFNGYDPIGLGQERLFRLAKRHAPHSMPLASLGVFLLLLGWLGFNGGTLLAGGFPQGASAGALDAMMSHLGSILMATVLAACASAATLAVLNTVLHEDLNLLDTMNGFIAGAVCATAGADILTPGEALLAGVAAALVFRASRWAFVWMSVDDPVAAISAHGFTGVLGAAVVGLAATDSSPALLVSQITIGLGVFACVLVVSLVFFTLTDVLLRVTAVLAGRRKLRDALRGGMLRIDYRTEIQGMDVEMHGQEAYGPNTDEQRR